MARGWIPPSGGVVAGAVVVAAPAVIVLFADALGIDYRTPFVQLIAFRWQLAAGLVVAGVLVWLLARFLWPLAVALTLVGLVGLLVVSPRALGGDGDPRTAIGEPLTVMSLNTYLGRADPGSIAKLVLERRPDVVVLPEAGGDLRRSLTRALDDDQGGSGYRSAIADRSVDVSPMTVFVSRGLGRPEVTVDRKTEFPSLIIDLPDDLRVVAVHPQSPKPGDTFAWRRDVAALSRWCADAEGPTIVAGDLNATFDHAELREATEGCTDAAVAVGDGLTGTWPTQLPSVFGAQIDHVLLAQGPRAQSVEFLEVAGTDHRAVLARVTRE